MRFGAVGYDTMRRPFAIPFWTTAFWLDDTYTLPTTMILCVTPFLRELYDWMLFDNQAFYSHPIQGIELVEQFPVQICAGFYSLS